LHGGDLKAARVTDFVTAVTRLLLVPIRRGFARVTGCYRCGPARRAVSRPHDSVGVWPARYICCRRSSLLCESLGYREFERWWHM